MNSLVQKERIVFLDALRGIAVLLMMEQHIGIWLWRPVGAMRFFNHPFFFTINGIGGLAGPLFVTIAGIGATLLIQKSQNVDRTLFFRGIIIILFGYLMNILTPGWFSVGSWFILHMIGFAVMTTPLFRRLPNKILLIISVSIIIGTVILYNILNTPLVLSNMRMRDTQIEGGIFRLIFIEGHYPILPWLTFYLLGIVAGRLLLNKQIKYMLTLAFASLSVGIIVLSCYLLKFSFAVKGPLFRFFRLHYSLFPMTPLFILLSFPLIIFLIIAFRSIETRWNLNSQNPLVCLGRTSLTIQIVHVVIFFEVFQRLNLFRTFSTNQTAILLIGILLFFTFLSTLWKRYQFKFGTEWLLRRIAG